VKKWTFSGNKHDDTHSSLSMLRGLRLPPSVCHVLWHILWWWGVGYPSHRSVASCYIRICCGIRLSAIKQKINKQTCSSLSTSTSCHASYHRVPPASQLVIVARLRCQNENHQFAVMKRMTEPSLGVGTTTHYLCLLLQCSPCPSCHPRCSCRPSASSRVLSWW